MAAFAAGVDALERGQHLVGADAGRSDGSFASSRRIDVLERPAGSARVCHDGATGGVLMCWRDHGRRVVARERRLAGDQLVQHAAERVEVGPRRHLAAERLLRRHVGHRADDHAVHRQPRLLERDGEAEVADLGRAVGGEPDVAGLEVAVDDAVLVRVGEPAADALRDLERALDRQRQLERIDVAAATCTG